MLSFYCICNFAGITGYDNDLCSENDSSSNSYDFLKDIDPVAANRIHPNNHRKV
jgi:tRNA dimethylallyltransferase